ncbi:hypothetical protein ACA910_011326 [Epithemia clementina (nom. ined.)]
MTSFEANDCNMNPKDFSFLQNLPGNLECIDCGAAKPDWGSPKLGILFCFQCSGLHRGLGTHISFVRSVTLDSWTAKQIQQMKMGGNANCYEFLTKHGVDMTVGTPVKDKYDTPAAELYRKVLLARVEGRPEPKEMPTSSGSTTARPSAPVVDPRRLTGFGNAPLPEAPQRKIQAVAIATTAVVVVGAAVVWFVSSL